PKPSCLSWRIGTRITICWRPASCEITAESLSSCTRERSADTAPTVWDSAALFRSNSASPRKASSLPSWSRPRDRYLLGNHGLDTSGLGHQPLRSDMRALAVVFLLLLPLAACGQDTFTPQHVAKLRVVTEAVIAPDGKQVAYVLAVPRNIPKEKDGPAW